MRFIPCLFLLGCLQHLRPNKPNRADYLQHVGLKLGVSPQAFNQLPMDDEQACNRLDNWQLGWNATAIGLGVLGGANGVTALAWPDGTTIRLITGSVALGLSAFGAVSVYLASQFTKRYTSQCTVNTGGKQDPIAH